MSNIPLCYSRVQFGQAQDPASFFPVRSQAAAQSRWRAGSRAVAPASPRNGGQRQELLPRPVLERLQRVGRELQHALAQRWQGQPLDAPREVGEREHDWRRLRRQAVVGPAPQQGSCM